MQLYTQLAKIEAGAGSAVALGFFDGVHLGHQAVICAAAAYGKQHGLAPAVFTFRLPLGSGMKQGRICTEENKHQLVEQLGVQCYLEPAFEEFCSLSPDEFVQDVLHGMLSARAVFCGQDFSFGKKAAGNIETLKNLCAPLGIKVHIVPMAEYEGDTISSSRIRAALKAGDIPAANAMLGRPYCIAFPVVHGKGLGRTLGFPTINQIYPEGFVAPKHGIYITRVLLNGRWHAGATGFGTRPTVNESGQNPTCETFISNYAGELYETSPQLEFYKHIAPVQKFETLEELAACVQGAAAQAVRYFAQQV